MNTLTINPKEQTYLDVEKLIKHIVWKFQRKYGGDFEELLGEANLLFILAYNDYDKEKAKFSTWLTFYITTRLQNKLLKETKHPMSQNRLWVLSADKWTKDTRTCPPPEDIVDLMDLFWGDTRYIVDLVSSPEKISSLWNTYCSKPRRGRGFSTFSFLKWHLKQDLNWPAKRITGAFNLIKNIIGANM